MTLTSAPIIFPSSVSWCRRTSPLYCFDSYARQSSKEEENDWSLQPRHLPWVWFPFRALLMFLFLMSSFSLNWKEGESGVFYQCIQDSRRDWRNFAIHKACLSWIEWTRERRGNTININKRFFSQADLIKYEWKKKKRLSEEEEYPKYILCFRVFGFRCHEIWWGVGEEKIEISLIRFNKDCSPCMVGIATP